MVFRAGRNLPVFLPAEVVTKDLKRALVSLFLRIYRLVALDAVLKCLVFQRNGVFGGSFSHRRPIYLPSIDGLFELAFHA